MLSPDTLMLARPASTTLAFLAAAALLVGCSRQASTTPAPVSGEPPATAAPRPIAESEVRRLLGALAHDSMEGRATAARGSERAARFIADELERSGVRPAGDSGFFQRVPVAYAERDGRRRLVLLPSLAARDTMALGARANAANVIGIIEGADAAVRDEVVLIGAHYDHVGIRRAESADSIFNGADDDASGVVAVLAIARDLAQGPPPRRTVIVAAMTGEEVGLLGTRWYVSNPVRPLQFMVANLEIEMIGRPDSLAGGPGRGWLTGYERSTMGDMFAAAALPIAPDKRPDQQFFMRSDNIAFARAGIVAHTLSSYNMHTDYHTPRDEVSRVDFAHMTRLVDVAVRAARLLADAPTKPEWKPGGKP
jgi:hypothetical protein